MILKPLKRHRATTAEWKTIREHFGEDSCWVCGAAWTDLHHILSRAHGGDDVTANLAPLDRGCHRRIEARDPVARSLLRGALMPSNLAYLEYRLGGEEKAGAFLQRNYPLGVAA